MLQHKTYNKVILVVFDGFGVASFSRGNAIAAADPKNLNWMFSQFPTLTLQASGPLVGLPWGEMGNSEVGHLNIGAGRVVGQDLPRINMAIQNRSFFSTTAFVQACEHVKQYNSTLHIMGLMSDGNVHASVDHAYALLGMAVEHEVRNIAVHMFTDGRDTGERVALDQLTKIEEKLKEIGAGTISTVAGRFYAMDRAKHWQQTRQTYDAMVGRTGPHFATAREAIQTNYDRQVFDEMIEPSVIGDGAGVANNDACIFSNFRSDRAIQLTEMFAQLENVPAEFRPAPLQNVFFVTMTDYDPGINVHVAFPAENLKNCLSEVVAANGLKQYHVAESEKYAHVTSFFNCGRTTPFPGEDQFIVQSPDDNKNYEAHPEMSAEKVTDALVEKITKTDINFFVANYANCDMVGHTGSLEAATAAVTAIDKQIKRVADAVLASDAVLLITADHGNAERMLDPKTAAIDKDHTTNPVPFIIVAQEFEGMGAGLTYNQLSALIPSGTVSDIAPVVLSFFGIPQPAEMTGVNLLKFL